jgi:hypothetical protein
MTDDGLAGRYRRLLACYPRWYREERGAELVGTLLDGARPGQVRPSGREAWALILEGLRLRAGTSAHRTARASLVGGLQVAVLLLIMLAVLRDVFTFRQGPDGPVALPEPAWWVLVTALLLCEVALFGLVAAGRFGAAVPASVVTGVLTTVGYPALAGEPGFLVYRTLVAGALLNLAGVVGLRVLSRRPGRNQGRITAGPVMLAWAVVPPLTLMLPDIVEAVGYGDADIWVVVQAVFVVLYLGALAYAGIDPRPALATAFALTMLLGHIVATVARLTEPPNNLLVVVSGYLVLAAPAGVAGWLGLRRQRAIRPLGVRS